MTFMSSLKAFLFTSPVQGGKIGSIAAHPTGAQGGSFADLLGEITPSSDGALSAPNRPSPLLVEGEAQGGSPLEMQTPAVFEAQALPPGDTFAADKVVTGLRMRAPNVQHANAPVDIDRPDGEKAADVVLVESGEDLKQQEADGSEAADTAPAALIALVSGFIAPPAVSVPTPEASEARSLAAISARVEGDGTSLTTTQPLPAQDAQRASVMQALPDGKVSSVLSGHTADGTAAAVTGFGEAAKADPSTLAPKTASPVPSLALRQAAPSGLKIVAQVETLPAAGIAKDVAPGKSAVDMPIEGATQPSAQPARHPSAVPPLPLATIPAVQTATAGASAGPVIPQQITASAALGTAKVSASDTATVDMSIDGEIQSVSTPSVLLMPNAPAPVKSEALSLLALVREHFVQSEGGGSPEVASAVPASRKVDPVVIDGMPSVSPATPAQGSVVAPVSAGVASSVQAMPATVDLGGTIAGQVIDMGVQGQWIDGLARDIASLSTNGAQGRFEIRSDHLGAVQVDIRPTAGGTTVNLTVTSEVAQQALQADGDRLIADAALSAMKITDLRVERGPVNEAQSADRAGQQSGSNGQSQNHAQNGSQATSQGQGQGLSQGMGQNRSGHRDNFSGNHKSAPDSAVLSQTDSRDGEPTGGRRAAIRARYA